VKLTVVVVVKCATDALCCVEVVVHATGHVTLLVVVAVVEQMLVAAAMV
jgi:hypothetical protein